MSRQISESIDRDRVELFYFIFMLSNLNCLAALAGNWCDSPSVTTPPFIKQQQLRRKTPDNNDYSNNNNKNNNGEPTPQRYCAKDLQAQSPPWHWHCWCIPGAASAVGSDGQQSAGSNKRGAPSVITTTT